MVSTCFDSMPIVALKELSVSFAGAVVDGHTANERLEVLKDELQVK